MLWADGPEVLAAISPACPPAAMAKTKKGPPIGFGRTPFEEDYLDDDGGARAPSEPQ